MISGWAALRREIVWEQRSYWRNPSAAAFTFAFPLMFLVIFIAINGNETVTVSGTRVPFAQFYVPTIMAFGLISACYTNLAFAITIRRETGLLKRVRGTPLPPARYLAGVFGSVMVVALILNALVLVLGLVAYGVEFQGRWLALVVTILVGAFCFGAIGVAVSSVVPNEDAAPAVINFLLFPVLFISGTFGPIKDGSTLARIADVLPVRHLNQQMLDVFTPTDLGIGLSGRHLAVMAAWGVAALGISLRRFRWEPAV